MTAVLAAAAPARAGGRPRDPGVDQRVLLAGRVLLADKGLGGFTADAVAAEAKVGKASLYRRWRTLDELLCDVVRGLGVRQIAYDGPGSALWDLARVLHAATSGRQARAELAVLSSLHRSPQLLAAYVAGPGARLLEALEVAHARARHRGEPSWPSLSGPLAGFRLLQHRLLLGGGEPSLTDAGDVVERVVLPALGYRP